MNTQIDGRTAERLADSITPVRLVLILLLSLASWEIGRVVATQVVLGLFGGSGRRLSFAPGAGWQFDTTGILVLQVLVSAIVALPVAPVLLRVIGRGGG